MKLPPSIRPWSAAGLGAGAGPRGVARRQPPGIALVITLIMLSVVTIMAVAFLAVARRERGAVTATLEQADSRFMADAAGARARAEIAARMVQSGGRLTDGFFVSTNYTLPDGLITGKKGNISPNDPENVFLPLPNQPALTKDQNERVLRNLLFDPRPPVLISTSSVANTPLDNRFFLDLNRNGIFEPTYTEIRPILDANGTPLKGPDASGQIVDLRYTNRIVGDPQWVGVLQDPTRPHSSSNRFIGRYAFLVVPSGRTLDLNYIHNHAKGSVGENSDGYFRNQGVGSWELNLAAYLRELNGGLWNSYIFNTGTGSPNIGTAFQSALDILRFRRREFPGNILSVRAQLAVPVVPQLNVFSDPYSDGPAADSPAATLANNDSDTKTAWPGSDQSHAFQDPFQLFDPAVTSVADRLSGKILPAGTTFKTTNYTFYNLLSSLGTDTPDGMTYRRLEPDGSYVRVPKLNINWAQGPNGDVTTPPAVDAQGRILPAQTGAPFRRWRAHEWFTNAADHLIRNELVYRADPGLEITNAYGFSVTNIPVVFTTNLPFTVRNPNGRKVRYDQLVTHTYDAQIHRLLQLAANIYDASHSSNAIVSNGRAYDFPTVFRPKFYRQTSVLRLVNGRTLTVTNVYIGGFAEVVNGAIATNGTLVHLDLDNPADVSRLPTNPAVLANENFDVNQGNAILAGIPWVIGAKRGFPSYNQGFWQTSLSVTRRLEVAKANATSTVFSRPNDFSTNVQYGLLLGRSTSQEAWNSYAADFQRPVQLYVSNSFQVAFAVDDDFARKRVSVEERPNFYVTTISNQFATSFGLDFWPGTDKGAGAFRDLMPRAGITNEFFFAPAGATSSDRTIAPALVPQFRRPIVGRLPDDQPFFDVRYPQSTPNLAVAMTNRLFYVVIDRGSGRIIDFVNLKSVSHETNLLDRFVSERSPAYTQARGRLEPFQPDHLWLTNRLGISSALTAGITNQMAASVFTNYPPYAPGPNLVQLIVRDARVGAAGREIPFGLKGALAVRWVLYRDPSFRDFGVQIQNNFRAVSPIAPTRTFLLTDRRAINDPLVHYTVEDLRPGTGWFVADGDATVSAAAAGGHGGRETPDKSFTRSNVGVAMTERKPLTYAPWGVSQILGASQSRFATDPGRKDPGIYRSDNWDFPTNQFPTLGWLGRIHRGTPWQTIYLKSSVPDFGRPQFLGGPSGVLFTRQTPMSEWHSEYLRMSDNPLPPRMDAPDLPDAWTIWAGNYNTHPVGDWHLLHLFTTAIHENQARGLMSSNQRESAAWAAVLSEVVADPATGTRIKPGTPQLKAIVDSINQARGLTRSQAFKGMGGFLAGRSLSVQSPYLPRGYATSRVLANQKELPRDADRLIERIPQQILSLMREDQPHFTVYAFGQALKPAPGSLINRPGPTYGLCTNYQITAEFATKSVVRYDGPLTNLQAVVERYNPIESR